MWIAVEDAFGYVESRGGKLLKDFTVSRLLGTDHRAVHRALKPLQDTSYVTSGILPAFYQDTFGISGTQ